MDDGHVPSILAAFDLGTCGRLSDGPVASGRLGSIWRLDTESGSWAVKQVSALPDQDLAELVEGAAVLPNALAMAATIVVLDLVWYSALAAFVARTRRAFVEGAWLRRAERLTGAVLVGLGVRLALERR